MSSAPGAAPGGRRARGERLVELVKVKGERDGLCGRFGQSLTLINNRIYMFGGYSDIYHGELYVYNDEGKWINLEAKVTSPRPRFGHVAFEYDDCLYIVGGDTGFKCLNDVWKYDLFNGTWTLLEVSGDIPAGRSCMTGHAHDGILTIFGGADRYGIDGPVYYNDVYTFDVKTGVWTYIKTNGDNNAFNKEHVKSRILDRVPEANEENEQLDPHNNKNSDIDNSSQGSYREPDLELTEGEDGNSLSLAPVAKANPEQDHSTSNDMDIQEMNEDSRTSSNYPCPRRGHVMFTGDNNIYIFGGVNSDGQMMNDLWVLNLNSLSWRQISSCINSSGSSVNTNNNNNNREYPAPRAFATFCQYNNNVIIFGGVSDTEYLNDFWSFDFMSENFIYCNQKSINMTKGSQNKQNSNDRSSVKNARNATAIKNEVELYYRPTTARTIEMKQTNKSATIGRYGASMEVKNGKFILFGGYSYLGMMHDTWELSPVGFDNIDYFDVPPEISKTPMNEEDINFELIVSGFKKFIREKIDNMTDNYNSKNGAVSQAVADFKTELINMIRELDDKHLYSRDNYNQLVSELNVVHENFLHFKEDNHRIIQLSGELNESLRAEFKRFEDEIVCVLQRIDEFNDNLRNNFETLNEKNTQMEDELNIFSENVNQWIEENSRSLNNRINEFGRRCDNYAADLENSVKRIDELNEQQCTFFSDIANKINQLRNQMDEFRDIIQEDYDHECELQEERIIDLDKQVDDLVIQVGEKKQKNFDTIEEIKKIIDECFEFIKNKMKEADEINIQEEEQIHQKIEECIKIIEEALQANRDKNSKYIEDTIKSNEDRVNKYMSDLLEIKEIVANTCAELDQKRKDFTDSVINNIDTTQSNTANNNAAKTEEMTKMTAQLNEDVLKNEEGTKTECSNTINEAKNNLIKSIDEKINSAFDETKKNSSEMLDAEEARFNNINTEILDRIKATNEKYDGYQKNLDELKHTIEELKEGKYDDYTEVLEEMKNINIAIENTIKNFDDAVEVDINTRAKHEDYENSIKQKGEYNITETESLSRGINYLENMTKENSEIIAHSKDNLNELINTQGERLDEIEKLIGEVIETNKGRHEEVIARTEAQKADEEQDKNEMIARHEEVKTLVTDKLEKINKIRNEFDEYTKDVEKRFEENATKIEESNATCQGIDIPAERFNSAENAIDDEKKVNEEMKQKNEEFNKKVEDLKNLLHANSEQHNNEMVEKFNEQVAEIDKIVQDEVYTPMEENKNKCYNETDDIVADLDKGIETLRAKPEILAAKVEEVKNIIGELNNDITNDQANITKYREEMGVSVDRVNELITEKRGNEHKTLKFLQDMLANFDEKNKKECEYTIFTYDVMSESTINTALESQQQYLKTVSVLENEFFKILPNKLEELEADVHSLDEAVTEVRKQVRAHAAELTAIKASLRDVACISEKAYESSSKLIGRVRTGEQSITE